MSPRDPDFSAKPIIETAPYTSTQRDEFVAGNQHTTGIPNRHPATSIFNSEEGNVLHAAEIKEHWINKGERLIEISPGV